MTAPHDTPEAVERHAEHVASCDLPETAAMLRRLHQRAVDAERERDGATDLIERMQAHDVTAIQAWHKAHPGNDLLWPSNIRLTAWCMGEISNLRAALATARADALREGLEAVKGIDTADIYSTGERHAAEEIRGFAMFLIGNLIEQPTTTGET